MESRTADRSAITLADHVDAVVSAVDAADSPVLLVGHSAGCVIAHCAVDARPDRVARVVHIGGFPVEEGDALVDGLTAENGEVLMPEWKEMGEEASISDFSPEQLATFYAEAIPSPAQVIAGPVRLSEDPRKYDVPATAVCPEYTSADLKTWVTGGDLPELARVKDVTYIDLPGGHWPQLTQPDALAAVLVDAAQAGT